MPYLYILRCADDSFYVGSTWHVDKRLWEHDEGFGANYTRRRRPVELAYACWFERIDEAYQREKQVQGWSRRKREALIEGRFQDLPNLARSKLRPDDAAEGEP